MNSKTIVQNMGYNNFIAVSSAWARKLGGLDASGVLQVLITKCKYFEETGLIEANQPFYLTAETIAYTTGLSRDRQKTIMDKLRAKGYISTELKGMPRTTYYSLNYDAIFTDLMAEEDENNRPKKAQATIDLSKDTPTVNYPTADRDNTVAENHPTENKAKTPAENTQQPLANQQFSEIPQQETGNTPTGWAEPENKLRDLTQPIGGNPTQLDSIINTVLDRVLDTLLDRVLDTLSPVLSSLTKAMHSLPKAPISSPVSVSVPNPLVLHQTDVTLTPQAFRQHLHQQLEIDEELAITHPQDMALIHALVDIITDTQYTSDEYIKVGTLKPTHLVRAQFSKLTCEHIAHVVQQFKQQGHEIKYKTAYLRTCLYTAVVEFSAHNINLVNVHHGVYLPANQQAEKRPFQTHKPRQSAFHNFKPGDSYDYSELDSIGFSLAQA